jgi:hypothetical protein
MKKRKGRRNKVEGNRTRGPRYIYVSSSLAKGERCVAKPAQSIRSDALSSARTNKQRGDSPGSDRSSPKDPHIRSLQSHRIVCNRSMKRRLVNDTSSSILLSRACDAARDGTLDETRTGVSPKHPTRASRLFRLGPSISPPLPAAIPLGSRFSDGSSIIKPSIDCGFQHAPSPFNGSNGIVWSPKGMHPSPRQGFTEAHMKPTWRFGLATTGGR